MSRFLCYATLVFLFLSTAASAGEGQQRLEQFFFGLKTMRAEFVQTVVDPDDNVVEENEGMLCLSRPDKFNLAYKAPYEQLYVADGRRVWLYDKDLRQVTVKPQQETLGSTPALLLSSTDPLTKNFKLKELGTHDGLVWLELKPRKGDSSFEFVRIAMEGQTLRAMEMVDGFGQKTRLYFDKIERNPKLDPALFRFEPPKGVDVVGEAP